jgi:hypothetical protein
MQMIQFLSTLQEAPRVFSDAISKACMTHSWEIFCCISGSILGSTVSTDISVTLPCILLSLIVILLMAHLMARYSIRLGPQFISLISFDNYAIYLNTQKFAASASRLSSMLLTVVTRCLNKPPHSLWSAIKFGLISVNMCTQRLTGPLW